MKAFIVLLLLVQIFREYGCENLMGITKIICHFSMFNHADFLKGERSMIKISKTLSKECDIKVRFLSDISDVEDFLVLFINQQTNNKETI